MILRMRPKKKAKTEVGERAEKKVERETKFPGLAIPDSKVCSLVVGVYGLGGSLHS